jgi:hypothetical protein
MNRETLKQAIAEAKTIKETAIANAKLALEEAFTPQLTAMFAERLNEMDEEEEKAKKSMEEMYGMEEEGIEETFDINSILAELEMTDEGDEMEKEGMDAGVDENLMLEEMSDEDIEELVAQVIDDMIKSGKLMAGEESEEEDMEDIEDIGDEDEEIDIDIEDDEEKDIDKTIAEILAEMEGETAINESEALNQFIDFVSSGNMEAAGNVIDAALASAGAGTAAGALGVGGSAIAFFKALKSYLKDKKAEVKEANEMEETINELRNELNEVNLLNAKLLYTNKIFKAKNLTESDKVKVLNAFDKAENVKGVKLVYETLTESLKATSIAKKSSIKESLGSASRTIAPATPKQPIIESNEAFLRMQKIAGLIK